MHFNAKIAGVRLAIPFNFKSYGHREFGFWINIFSISLGSVGIKSAECGFNDQIRIMDYPAQNNFRNYSRFELVTFH